MSNQGDRQATVRTATGTAGTYESDWHALFDLGSVTAGPFNDRLLAWLNAQMSSAFTELNGAMTAFAATNGAPNWSQMGVFTIGGGSSAALLLESGGYLLLENGGRLLLG